MLATVQVETSLVLLDFIGGDISLTAHGPNRGQYINVLANVRTLGELPVVIVHMAIDLSDDCFHKIYQHQADKVPGSNTLYLPSSLCRRQ